MPNQRSKDRAFLGVFISKNLKGRLIERAGHDSVSISTLVVTLLEESLAASGKATSTATPGLTESKQHRESMAKGEFPLVASGDEEIWML